MHLPVRKPRSFRLYPGIPVVSGKPKGHWNSTTDGGDNQKWIFKIKHSSAKIAEKSSYGQLLNSNFMLTKALPTPLSDAQIVVLKEKHR